MRKNNSLGWSNSTIPCGGHEEARGDRDGTEVLWKRWLLGFLCLCRPLERGRERVCVTKTQTLKGKLVNASVLSRDCTARYVGVLAPFGS